MKISPNEMSKTSPNLSCKLLFMLSLSFAACFQTSGQAVQFLPEIDTYTPLLRDARLDFQAKETREAGDPTQAELGPSLDFFLKPLIRLKNVTQFDLDDAKSRPLQLSIGYGFHGLGEKALKLSGEGGEGVGEQRSFFGLFVHRALGRLVMRPLYRSA